MVELIVGLAIALGGAILAYRAKEKKAIQTEEKLRREQAVLKEAIEIQETARRRAADRDERERVRAKYTRKGDEGDADMLSPVSPDKHVSGRFDGNNGTDN